MTPLIAGYCQTLTEALLEREAVLTEEQLLSIGIAARNILAFAWTTFPRNSALVKHAIKSVCQTFETDPIGSALLLRPTISPEQLATNGYEEIPIIARESKQLSLFDPEFVADIYGAVFAYEEVSSDKTEMTASSIFSLTSNRRQDYEHAKWQLAENYSHFAANSPIAATRAMVSVMDSYTKTHHTYSDSAPRASLPFDVGGSKEGVLVTDYSHLWDDYYALTHKHELRILDAFFGQLERYVQDTQCNSIVDAILDVLMVGQRAAAIWRRLLQLGIQRHALLPRLKQLAWAVPLLEALDTRERAADFVVAVYSDLIRDDKRKVEQAILSSTATAPEEVRVHANRWRDEVLRRLPTDELVTTEAQDIVRHLQPQSQDSEIRANLPKDWTWDIVPNEEARPSASSEMSDHESKTLLDLKKYLETFNAEQRNKEISGTELSAVLPKLQGYLSAIEGIPKDLDRNLVSNGWGVLAESCKIAASSPDLWCPGPVSTFLQNTLVELSRHTVPEHDPTSDASFDEHVTWSGPLPRIEAATGLMMLARHGSCCTEDVLDAIARVAGDPAPEVRFQVAANLTLLWQTAREQMWRIFETRAAIDTSNAVLGMLAQSILRLADKEPDRAFQLTKGMFERIHHGPGKDDARRTCIHTFVGLAIWRDHKGSADLLYQLIQDARTNRREVAVIINALRPTLAQDDSAVRQRAVQLFAKSAAATCTAFDATLVQLRADGSQAVISELFRELAKSVDYVAAEVLFASGVRINGHTQDGQLSFQQERFYNELAPTIDLLIQTGLSAAIHHLGQMLEAYISLDPRRVFLQIAAAVESGTRWDYHYESLAADLIVRIVERYLAEQRPLLQEDVECRTALRNTLDTFVQAGWPSAQRLAYRLDEIFR